MFNLLLVIQRVDLETLVSYPTSPRLTFSSCSLAARVQSHGILRLPYEIPCVDIKRTALSIPGLFFLLCDAKYEYHFFSFCSDGSA